MAPLAKLPNLSCVDLSGCDKVSDLSPLREMVRRGGYIVVHDRLKEKLAELKK